MSDEKIPAKDTNVQAEAAIDNLKVDNSGNTMPDDLDVDAGSLFIQATEQTRMALCLADPHQPDMPIVYLNEAFTDLTGYERDEVLGKNCRFLQGEDTEPEAAERIRKALAEEKVAVIDILNYTRDGKPFWNALHIGPIYSKDGKLQYFYGSQWNVTEVFRQREEMARQKYVTEELQHRTGNLFAVLSAIVRLSARGESDAAVLANKIEDRLGALARAHRVSIASGDTGADATDLRGLVDAVIKPYQTNRDERISVAGDALKMPRDVITPIGLSLHELATNAVKYGSLGNPNGTVSIEWSEDEHFLSICWIEKGGQSSGAPESNDLPSSGTGTRIVSGILASIDAKLEQTFTDEGMTATIRLPRTTPGD